MGYCETEACLQNKGMNEVYRTAYITTLWWLVEKNAYIY